MEVINKLVDKGNTILIIEHNMDVIKLADYIIDIGPEGGKGGGQLIAKGTPEEVAKNKKSYTAKYLKKELLQLIGLLKKVDSVDIENKKYKLNYILEDEIRRF